MPACLCAVTGKYIKRKWKKNYPEFERSIEQTNEKGKLTRNYGLGCASGFLFHRSNHEDD